MTTTKLQFTRRVNAGEDTITIERGGKRTVVERPELTKFQRKREFPRMMSRAFEVDYGDPRKRK